MWHISTQLEPVRFACKFWEKVTNILFKKVDIDKFC
jgi:hypothetical protein